MTAATTATSLHEMPARTTIELYCTVCRANHVHYRSRWTALRIIFSLATLGLTVPTFVARRDVCSECGRRRASRPALAKPPELTADEVAGRHFTCRVCGRVNSMLELECLQCAAPRPRTPATPSEALPRD